MCLMSYGFSDVREKSMTNKDEIRHLMTRIGITISLF